MTENANNTDATNTTTSTTSTTPPPKPKTVLNKPLYENFSFKPKNTEKRKK